MESRKNQDEIPPGFEKIPPPDRLLKDEKTVKVTLYLKPDTVEYFKKQARKYESKYQQMIRRVLEIYQIYN